MSRFTRGIFGKKPTTAGSSDIVSVDQQYSASVNGTWPTSTSSTGFVAAENFRTADLGFITYSKKSDGLYYPGLFVESAPAANYIVSGDSNTQFGSVLGLSVSKGGTHAAVIVTTHINYQIQDLFIWKNVPYGNTSIWRYVTVLTSGTTSEYASCVAFHPSGNYLAYGTTPGQSFGTLINQLYILSRSGDSFTSVSIPHPTGNYCGVTAVEWNADGTSLAVLITASPYIVIYNFSNGTFTKLSTPASIPTQACYSLSWNPSGSSLVIGQSGTSPMKIYNRSGNTFTAISGLPALANGTTYAGSMSWNNTGTLLAYTNGTTDIAVWSRSGDSFNALSIPSVLISGQTNHQAQFNPNGKELLVTQTQSMDIWDVNGTTITRRTTSPFGAYAGPSAGVTYGSRMGTTYGGGDTYAVYSPTQWVRWIPPA